MKPQVLIIDDNPTFISDFTFFTRDHFEVIGASTGEEGLAQIRLHDPEIVLLDLKLKHDESGLDVLKQIKKLDPDLPVLIITAYPDVDTAVQAMRLGAAHYGSKAPDFDALISMLKQLIQAQPWRRLYREELEKKYGQLLGKSGALQRVRKQIAQCARNNFPVLISGESGTGKELVAAAIHRQSDRAGQVMISVNCSTLPPELFESEFFGHEKGAFTGALTRKKGKIELAEYGTLFLDEIADLPLASQPKILEAIEYKRYDIVGGETKLDADVRFIAATNRDLRQAVKEGAFREDLYYRLNVLNIHIPPLRERPEDIPELARHFLEIACIEMRRPVPRISEHIMKAWKNLSWPGNVRELQHYMTRIAIETEGDVVNIAPLENTASPAGGIVQLYQEVMQIPYSEAKQRLLDHFQQDYICAALARNGKNISKTAAETGIHRTTIHRILQSLSAKTGEA